MIIGLIKDTMIHNTHHGIDYKKSAQDDSLRNVLVQNRALFILGGPSACN